MVADEERREVAQKLRERTNRPLEAGVIYFAELIDRPTCNVESLGVGYVDAKCHTFRCETCKSEIDVHIGEEQDATAYARFCPYCGMEIER